MTKKFVDENNTQSRPDSNYGKVIQDIAKAGVCPFCTEHLAKYHKNPIEEKSYWLVTDNMYPYTPSKVHKLIISRKHITHLAEISDEAWMELKQIGSQECAKLDIAGGTIAMRFGDTKFTGASVSHLHVHIVQSDPDDKTYDKTRGLIMRIG